MMGSFAKGSMILRLGWRTVLSVHRIRSLGKRQLVERYDGVDGIEIVKRLKQLEIDFEAK